LDEAVLAFDEATTAHVVSIARRGRELKRHARAFGLVGDSITEGAFFFDAFGVRSQFSYALSPEVEQALRTPVLGDPARTIVDYYRGVRVETLAGGFIRDSFRATRAAKSGARSVWAIPDGRPSPLVRMVDTISPAVAIVMFGTNDAAYGMGDPAPIARAFEERMRRIVDALEQRGVIPVLTTIPRHMVGPGRAMCDPDALSNWRLVVQTNAVNAVVAKIACERGLPLIDYRHALDALVNRGVGWDGVHPTAFTEGAGKLTSDGLECGFNVRNYVTLRMLKQIKEEVLDRADESPASEPK
jgi:lysophospholipase L1-like esterase